MRPCVPSHRRVLTSIPAHLLGHRDGPVVARVLSALADDIVSRPERLHALDTGWVTRLRALVGDVTVDLKAPLPDEEP